MKNNKRCLFYGSLRNDGYNAKRMISIFGSDEYKLIKQENIKGFKLYDTKWGFPAVVTTHDSSEVVMEVFNVSDRVAEYIKAMEIGAGYEEAIVMMDGEAHTIYIYSTTKEQFVHIPEGDWIKYLNK